MDSSTTRWLSGTLKETTLGIIDFNQKESLIKAKYLIKKWRQQMEERLGSNFKVSNVFKIETK